jgi:hypothetical protein
MGSLPDALQPDRRHSELVFRGPHPILQAPCLTLLVPHLTSFGRVTTEWLRPLLEYSRPDLKLLQAQAISRRPVAAC